MTSKLYLGLGILILIASGVYFLFLIFVGIGPHQVCETNWTAFKMVCTTIDGYELYKDNVASTVGSLIGLVVGDLFVLSYIFPDRHYTKNRTAFWSIFVLLLSFLLVVIGYLVIYIIVYFNTPYIVYIVPI